MRKHKPHTPCDHSLTVYEWVRKLMAQTDPPLNATEMAAVMNHDPKAPKPRRMANTRRPPWWTKIDLHSLRARLKSKDEKCGNRAAINEGRTNAASLRSEAELR